MKGRTRYVVWIILTLAVVARQTVSTSQLEDGQMVRITGRVSLEPIRYETSQSINILGLRAFVPLYPEVNYGDMVVVEGVVEEGRLQNPEIIKIKRASGVLYKLRNRIIAFYQSVLPEPHASLVAGVTIGSRGGMPPAFWDKLKETGTAHVVVASGMNVTLVSGFLINLFIAFFSRRKAIPMAFLGIWGYSVIAGFDAPIIRAAIMGSFALSAQALGRIYYAWNALFLSAGGMLIYDPDWLYDLGFLLSFSATASLMLFQAKVDRYVRYVPSIFREGFSTSLAAQIGVAPILYLTFGGFNILSPVINAMVLWSVGPVTSIGMFSGMIGLVAPQLGRYILYTVYPLTSWFVYVVELFSK